MNTPRSSHPASNDRQCPGRFARALAVFSLAGLTALAGGCAVTATSDTSPTAHPAPASLVTAQATPLDTVAMTGLFSKADYVLAGEEHPNPCDHEAQTGIVRRMTAMGLRPVIGFEMVPADRQAVLDAFNAGKLAVADLPRALDWQRTWGYDFALYAPVFEAAREYGLPTFALNVPKGLVRKVARQGLGALSPRERASLPGALVPPDPAQLAALREVFDQHAAMRAGKPGKPAPLAAKAPEPKSAPGDDAAFTRFTTVQSLWDTQMAARAHLARVRSGRPVVIIAGGGHVERGWGIARRLAHFDPTARIVTIMPWRGGPLPDPEDARLFFACPVIHKTRLGMTLTHEPAAKGQQDSPLLVSDVVPDSPAAKAGMLAGDAVTEAGDHKATDLSVLHTAAMEAARAGKPLRLTVWRAGEILTLSIPLPAGR